MSPLTAALPKPLRWFYYTGDPSWSSLQANFNGIDVISPNFYRLDSQGNITGHNQPVVTDFARAKGIKIIPMLQNDPQTNDFSTLMSNPVKVRNILDTIEHQVSDNAYDGYQIDFENLNAASEAPLTSFMRQLNQRLSHQNKLTTMAVVSRTDASTNVFSAAYNYRTLAPFLDLVTIMTYDFAWPMGDPGPVAPVHEQERIMNFAISCFGPDKCLMGIPFYGYDWNLAHLHPVRQRAVTRTYPDTMRVQRENNGILSYNQQAETPLLEYRVNGENHQVWFEDPRSLSAKISLMKRLGVKGFAVWRLGHEGPEFWPVIAGLSPSGPKFFPEIGHNLQGTFRRFWEENGGLDQFGFPLTEEIDIASPGAPGQNRRVQYFERARFEHHAELTASGSDVLLGLVGREVTTNRENELPFQKIPDPQQASTISFFPETGHSLRGEFKNYWGKHGALAIYGFPITEEFRETNPADGQDYTVQYFERARFELHQNPDGTLDRVMLGLLGREVLPT